MHGKGKHFTLKGDNVENDQTVDEMPKRPMGQKATKEAALAAKRQLKQPGSDNVKGDNV